VTVRIYFDQNRYKFVRKLKAGMTSTPQRHHHRRSLANLFGFSPAVAEGGPDAGCRNSGPQRPVAVPGLRRDHGDRSCAMTATIMQALDTTIANVALPYMQGTLSASQDQINWVLTSYIVAAAIMTAPVGWIANRSGASASSSSAPRVHACLSDVRPRPRTSPRWWCFA
jgi:hypothetical protein